MCCRLQSMLPRWGAVVCAETAHIHTDENGAPERVGGTQAAHRADARRQAHPRARRPRRRGAWATSTAPSPARVDHADHRARHRCTRADEVRALADHAHALGMRLHIDGCPDLNAAAALGVPLRAFTTDAGVDVLSFGGTKNGLLFGEAVVVLNPEACDGPDVPAQDGHAARRRRCASSRAQLIALFERRPVAALARHANAMAARLRAGIEDLPRRAGHPADPGQRRLRDPPARRRRPAARALAVLRLGPRDGRGPAGCARSTPPRPTSTHSRWRCARN